MNPQELGSAVAARSDVTKPLADRWHPAVGLNESAKTANEHPSDSGHCSKS
jgi:hypothetical protein